MLKTIRVGLRLLPHVLKLRDYRLKTLRGEKVDEGQMYKDAEKFLNVIVSLGPAFIKFGQVLSVHSDILPEPYLKVLSKLQDDVPPAPWEEVVKILKEDLGDRFYEFEINTKPISSASIGQVYIAKRRSDGKVVVIKVNRPRIKEIAEEDIKIMKALLPYTKYLMDESFYESLRAIVNDFSKRIFEEMDFTREEFYMRKIREELADFPDIVIPVPYFSTKRVLVMEYVKGYKVTSAEAKKIVKPDELAYRIFKAFMIMLLEKDYFHADPHPGNLAVDEKGNLIIYDFGMVGRMDHETRLRLLRAYVALIKLDGIGLVKVLEELGAIQPEADREILAKGIELFLQQFQGVTAETLEVEQFLEAANEVFYRFPLKLPEKLSLYIRMTSILGSTCLQIDPEFNFFLNLQRLIEEEGLVFQAMLSDMRNTVSAAIRKFRLSILEKPIVITKNKNRVYERILSISLIVVGIIYYLLTKDSTIALLIGILALIVSLSRGSGFIEFS
ncbi:glycosyl transferase family 1 [Stygiolobus caldivivus]|uniref:Glycosyl transferase family 1 n=1 Tax=Stygiolobus caldivivus TaxID=2824673 RepID=A0A8D5ZKJ8_9CREN|nr:glycosyl transferase family 1 [Stygiolobus caldivivus]